VHDGKNYGAKENTVHHNYPFTTVFYSGQDVDVGDLGIGGFADYDLE